MQQCVEAEAAKKAAEESAAAGRKAAVKPPEETESEGQTQEAEAAEKSQGSPVQEPKEKPGGSVKNPKQEFIEGDVVLMNNPRCKKDLRDHRLQILAVNKKKNTAKIKVLDGPMAGKQKNVPLDNLKKRRAPLNFAAASSEETLASPSKKPCIEETRSIATSLWGEAALAMD